MKLQCDSLMSPISESAKVTMCALKIYYICECTFLKKGKGERSTLHSSCLLQTPPSPPPAPCGRPGRPQRRPSSILVAGPPAACPRSGRGPAGSVTAGRRAAVPGDSPQLFVDTLAGLLLGGGYHRGSRRGLVLQDPLNGPVRSRRGRHCPPPRR